MDLGFGPGEGFWVDVVGGDEVIHVLCELFDPCLSG
jgi:hypothetical protein